MEEVSSKLRGTASKGSSSSSSPSSIFSSNSSFNPNSDSNYNSNSNSDSNSSSDSNSNSNSNSDSNSNSNLQSSRGTKGEATLPCRGRSPFTNSHIETKFDIKNKICNRCRVIKQITCFGKKEVNM